MVAREAMAHGRPVVATSVGGLARRGRRRRDRASRPSARSGGAPSCDRDAARGRRAQEKPRRGRARGCPRALLVAGCDGGDASRVPRRARRTSPDQHVLTSGLSSPHALMQLRAPRVGVVVLRRRGDCPWCRVLRSCGRSPGRDGEHERRDELRRPRVRRRELARRRQASAVPGAGAHSGGRRATASSPGSPVSGAIGAHRASRSTSSRATSSCHVGRRRMLAGSSATAATPRRSASRPRSYGRTVAESRSSRSPRDSAGSRRSRCVQRLSPRWSGSSALWAVGGWRTRCDLVRQLGPRVRGGRRSPRSHAVDRAHARRSVLTRDDRLLTGAAICAVAIGARRPLARFRPEPRERRVRGAGLVAAVFGLMVVVYLEALFRAGRLLGLSTWDAWAFWVPKAKAIYFFGGLDEQFFRELPNPSYPPLLPALEASAFHFMGSPDVVTLHLQFWFFACGFVGAVAGLLAPRVQSASTVAVPRARSRLASCRGSKPRAAGRLPSRLLLRPGGPSRRTLARRARAVAPRDRIHVPRLRALLTKREGLLLAACIVVAALVASWRDWRFAWPRLGLAAAVAVVAAIPWRIWFTSRDLPGDLPAAGASRALRRARPWLARLRVDDHDDLRLRALARWSCRSSGRNRAGLSRGRPRSSDVRAHAVRARNRGSDLGAVVVHRARAALRADEGVNPIVRLSGSLVLAAAAILPLLLDAAWRGTDSMPDEVT